MSIPIFLFFWMVKYDSVRGLFISENHNLIVSLFLAKSISKTKTKTMISTLQPSPVGCGEPRISGIQPHFHSGFCTLFEWLALLQYKVPGSSPEGEHGCIALSALCKGNHDLYVLNKNKHNDIESDLVT